MIEQSSRLTVSGRRLVACPVRAGQFGDAIGAAFAILLRETTARQDVRCGKENLEKPRRQNCLWLSRRQTMTQLEKGTFDG